jgi:hypothetical protein
MDEMPASIESVKLVDHSFDRRRYVELLLSHDGLKIACSLSTQIVHGDLHNVVDNRISP